MVSPHWRQMTNFSGKLPKMCPHCVKSGDKLKSWQTFAITVKLFDADQCGHTCSICQPKFANKSWQILPLVVMRQTVSVDTQFVI